MQRRRPRHRLLVITAVAGDGDATGVTCWSGIRWGRCSGGICSWEISRWGHRDQSERRQTWASAVVAGD